MSNKSLDGIKKLNKIDARKARKTVLDYIHEDSSNPIAPNNVKRGRALRMIDGISKTDNRKQKTENRKRLEEEKILKAQKEKLALEKKREIEEKIKKEKVRMAAIRKEQEEKRILEKQKAVEAEEIKLQQQAEDIKKANGILEEAQSKRDEKKRRKNKKLARRAEERKEKKEKKQEKKKAKQIKKEIARQKRLKFWRALKRGIKKFFIAFLKQFRLTGKVFFKAIAIFALLAVVFYAIFVLIIVNFRLDNKLSRQVAVYLPVPAIVSNIGIIEYFDYVDALKSGANNIKLTMVKRLIVKDLAKKYNLKNSQKIQEQLNFIVVRDDKINKVPMARINKIQKMVKSEKDFEAIIKKYGDRFSIGQYVDSKSAILQFGRPVVNLDIGQVSNIIINADGYYIVQLFDKKNKLLGLKYVFIKAKTLDDYLNEEAGKLRVWSLIEL